MKKKIIFIASISIIVVLVATTFYDKGKVSSEYKIEKNDSIPNFLNPKIFILPDNQILKP